MDKVHKHNSFNTNIPSSESYINDSYQMGTGDYFLGGKAAGV
jgi:hypothetical protein